MPRLSTITHVNPNVQSKVNYFADYLKTYNHLLGLDHNFEFENPLSVIYRISYQISHNISYRHNYLPGLFKELRKFDPFLCNYDLYKNIHENIDSIKIHTKKKCDNWISIHNDEINHLQSVLENSMFDNSVYDLINLLSCRHTLSEHKKQLEMVIKFIVTYLRFKNRPKMEVSDIINRITSKKPKNYLIPNHLQKDDEIETFLQNRTFKDQFEGIIFFEKSEKIKEIFVFIIFDIESDFKGTLEYNNVTFSGPQYWKIKNLQKEAKKHKNYFLKDFFEQSNVLYAWVEVEYLEKEVGKLKAIKTIQRALDYINITLGLSGKLDTHKFISTFDFTSIGGTAEFKKNEIDNDSRNKINNKNPYRLLKNNNSTAAIQFVNFEHIYQRAIISGEIIDFWQYLECIFEESDEKNIFDKCSIIIANDKVNKIRYSIEDTIFNMLTNLGSSIGQPGFLTMDEVNQIMSTKSRAKFLEIVDRFNSPIVYKLKAYLLELATPEYDENLKNYIGGILKQLYEMRNAFIHQGVKNNENELKLQLIVPGLIETLRKLILNKIKGTRTSSLKEIIHNMVHRSKTEFDCNWNH